MLNALSEAARRRRAALRAEELPLEELMLTAEGEPAEGDAEEAIQDAIEALQEASADARFKDKLATIIATLQELLKTKAGVTAGEAVPAESTIAETERI